jgi:DNA-binding NarL/FixJ family response regulator
LSRAAHSEILSAIRAVSEDRPYASSSVASKALQRMAKPSLTQRELGVLQLLAEGRSNKDIARRLSIPEGTAKTHVKAILTKLDAISRTEAVAVAHMRGLVRLWRRYRQMPCRCSHPVITGAPSGRKCMALQIR